jgi:hypothetical protein
MPFESFASKRDINKEHGVFIIPINDMSSFFNSSNPLVWSKSFIAKRVGMHVGMHVGIQVTASRRRLAHLFAAAIMFIRKKCSNN